MAEVIQRDINLNFSADLMSTAILNPIFIDDDFRMFFRVDTEATNKKKVPFIDFKQNVLRVATGCKPEEVELIEVSERCFDVHEHSSRVPMCYDEFKNTLFLGGLNRGVAKADLTNTEIGMLLVQGYQVAVKKDLQNSAWFGRRSMSTVAGYESLQVADGMWGFYIPELNTAGDLQFTAANAALVGGAGDATDLLRSVYNNQKNVLKALPIDQKYIAVSSDVYEAYLEDLETVNGAGCCSETVENGRAMLTFRGIKVVQMLEWETTLSGLGINLAVTPANFVLLTTNNNLWFGTDSNNPEQELDLFYDKYHKTNNIDSSFNIGFNYLHADFMSVAANEAVLTAIEAL